MTTTTAALAESPTDREVTMLATTTQHVARVAIARPSRYPFVPACSCGWTDWGFVADHAAQILVDAHVAQAAEQVPA